MRPFNSYEPTESEVLGIGMRELSKLYEEILNTVASIEWELETPHSSSINTMNTYTGNIVPEKDTIFVFGSNTKGIHGGGSARVALNHFGAKYGQAEGLQGDSYALPTTYLYGPLMPLSEITDNVKKLYQCARENPDKKFKVAYRNQPDERTLCGYSGKELMSCFKAACDGDYPSNIYFSQEWANSGLL